MVRDYVAPLSLQCSALFRESLLYGMGPVPRPGLTQIVGELQGGRKKVKREIGREIMPASVTLRLD